MTEATKSIGQQAFEAYNASRGGVNHRGERTPDWEDLPKGIRNAWEVGAMAAALGSSQRPETAHRPAGHVMRIAEVAYREIEAIEAAWSDDDPPIDESTWEIIIHAEHVEVRWHQLFGGALKVFGVDDTEQAIREHVRGLPMMAAEASPV